MTYVEQLRIVRDLRVWAIVLLCLAALVTSLFFVHGVNVNDDSSDRPTHVSATGAVRIDVNTDRKGDVTITKTIREANGKDRVTVEHHQRTKSFATTGDILMIALFIAAFGGAIFATSRASLASENNGHLEIAWTKPVSRLRYIGMLFTLDIASIVGMALGCVLLLLVVAAIVIFGRHLHVVAQVKWADVSGAFLLMVTFPLAWFGLIQASTASLRERAGLVTGILWPIAFLLEALKAVPVPPIHLLVSIVNVINPLTYAQFQHGGGHDTSPAVFFAHDAALAVLGAAGCCLAAWQWRRLEI